MTFMPSVDGSDARVPTKLEQDLAARKKRTRPTPMDALRQAKRNFLRQQRIDMSVLAEQLEISRVTLYRWVGSREKLLVEVTWSLTEFTIGELNREVRATGSERVVRIAAGFLRQVIDNAGMKHWIATEGELAMRLMTRRDTDFQPRLIESFRQILQEETDAGRMSLPADLDEVAYVIVRIIESYTYLNIITGQEPNIEKAEGVLRLLLR
jgi:AcrR family transcriptional regulator